MNLTDESHKLRGEKNTIISIRCSILDIEVPSAKITVTTRVSPKGQKFEPFSPNTLHPLEVSTMCSSDCREPAARFDVHGLASAFPE